MSDLNDLKNFAEDVAPIVESLIKEWTSNQQPPDTAAEVVAIDSLKKLLQEAKQPTTRSREQCVEVLEGLYSSLTDILTGAASNPTGALSRTQARTVGEQLLAIKATLGQLSEKEALAPLASLLSQADIDSFSTDLAGARAGIQEKRTAQAILDTVVDVVIIAAKIAVKVAGA